MKKLIIFLVLAFSITGCSDIKDANEIKTKSQMPPVVFAEIRNYDKNLENEFKEKSLTGFYDNKGNYYIIPGDYFFLQDEDTKKFREKLKEFEKNKDSLKMKFMTSCDTDELFINYQKLCLLTKNKDFEVKTESPCTQAIIPTGYFYGIYYDKKKRPVKIKLRIMDNCREVLNDDIPNQIYDWYENTLIENKKEQWQNYIDKINKKTDSA